MTNESKPEILTLESLGAAVTCTAAAFRCRSDRLAKRA